MSHHPAPYGGSPHGLPMQPYGPTPLPQPNSGAHIAVSWVVTVFTLLYTLPWAIAATRQKQNTAMIALINVLTGWTGVGWVVSLVLACLTDPAPQQAPQVSQHISVHHHTYGSPYHPTSAPQPAIGPGRSPGWEPEGYVGTAASAPSASPYDYRPLPAANRLGSPDQHAFGMGSVDPYATYPQVQAPPPVLPQPRGWTPTAGSAATAPLAPTARSGPSAPPPGESDDRAGGRP